MDLGATMEVKLTPIVETFFMEAEIDISDWDALCEAATNFKDKYEVDACTIQYEDTALMPRIDDTPVVREMVDKINQAVGSVVNYDLALYELWGCKKQYKQSMMFHSHYDVREHDPDNLSFAFYAQADERNGALCFPIHIYGVAMERRFVPKRGKLIVFPSWLFHYTQHEDNPDAPDRIVISGNYGVVE